MECRVWNGGSRRCSPFQGWQIEDRSRGCSCPGDHQRVSGGILRGDRVNERFVQAQASVGSQSFLLVGDEKARDLTLVSITEKEVLKAHREALIGEEAFDFGNGVFTEVKNAGGEDGVGASRGEDVVEMGEFAGAAAGNDGDADGFADSAGDDEVVACFGAIGVDGIEDDFAGPEGDGFGGPIDGIEACGFATTLDKNFPAIWGSFFGIDADDDALATEAGGAGSDEVWGGEGAGVDADFIGAAFEHEADVVDCADATADG